MYQAYKNSIPVFCPAITDGSIGDMLAQFHIRTRARAPFPLSGPSALTPTPSNPNPAPSSPSTPFPLTEQGLIIDVVPDIAKINGLARDCQTFGAKMGAIVLGAGVVKHHVMNACLAGGGADAAVYINTASEFDGSDAGANPSEAVSWGKLKAGAPAVKVVGDATILMPMLVATTWAKHE